MTNFLDISEVIDAMQNEGSITALVPADNIFDNIPSDAPDTAFIIVEGAISQTNKLCNKVNRVSIRVMAWNKDSGTYPTLRNIYSVVNDFLVWANKTFGTISVYLVEETTYLETTDELWKGTIINDYFFNYTK